MSGLLALIGPSSTMAEDVLARMAAAAPHRGELTTSSSAGACLGVQNRAWGASSSRAGLARDGAIAVAAVGTVRGFPDVSGGAAAQRILDLYRDDEARLATLRGPCAFVLWDADRGHLIVRRDQLATRSLFYARVGSLVAVGSEVKQLAAVPGVCQAPDDVGLRQHVLMIIDAPERTCVTGVRRVGGGHWLTGPPHALVDAAWWQRRAGVGSSDQSPAEAAIAFRSLLAVAVARGGPGPHAVLLSGGLDSGAVAAAAAEVARRSGTAAPTAISGFYPEHPAVDETRFIEAVVKHLGLSLHRVQPRPRPFAGLQEETALHDGPSLAPMGDNMRQLFVAARDAGSRILLDGHDGDGLLASAPGLLIELLRTGDMHAAVRHVQNARRRGRSPVLGPLRQALASRAAELPIVRHLVEARRRRRLPKWLGRQWADALSSPQPRATWEDVQLEFTGPAGWLCLEELERMALAVGVEVLHPLFDEDLVDLVLALPANVKCADGRSKGVLRQAYTGHLPAEVCDRMTKTLFSDAYRSGSSPASILSALDAIEVPPDWLDRDRLREALRGGEGAALSLPDLRILHQLLRAAICKKGC